MFGRLKSWWLARKENELLLKRETRQQRRQRERREKRTKRKLGKTPIPIQQPSKKSSLWKSLEVGIGAASLIAGVVSLLLAISAEPNISLEPPLNSDKILSTPFVISNNGLVGFENVKAAIMLKDFMDSGRNTINIGASDWSITTVSKEMKPGDRKTIPAPFQRIVDTAHRVVSGEFALIISFRPAYFPFWEKRRAFLFTVVEQSDGRSRFEQQPAEGIEKEYEDFRAMVERRRRGY